MIESNSWRRFRFSPFSTTNHHLEESKQHLPIYIPLSSIRLFVLVSKNLRSFWYMNYAFIRYIRRKIMKKSSCYLHTLKDYTLNRREYNNSALDIICQIAYNRIWNFYTFHVSRKFYVFASLARIIWNKNLIS